MANTMTISEAKAELTKIIDVKIFPYRVSGDMTLFLICNDRINLDEVNTIIRFNKFEIEYSKNEYGEYLILLVFIDGKFEIPISTRWTNENYANFRLLETGEGIYFVNTALEDPHGFNIPFENKFKFIKHYREKDLTS